MLNRYSSRRRFSFIEVLLSITIILIIFTLLVPGLRKAIQKSQTLQCTAKLNNLNQGYQQLMNEFEGGRLVGYKDNRLMGNYPEPYVWIGRIRKYIFKGEVAIGRIAQGITQEDNLKRGGLPFVCPHNDFYFEADANTPGIGQKVWKHVISDDASSFTSYGLNFDTAGEIWESPSGSGQWNLPPMKSQIQHPEKMALLADSGWDGMNGYAKIKNNTARHTINLSFGTSNSVFGISRHGPYSDYDLKPLYESKDSSNSIFKLIPLMEINMSYFDGKSQSEPVSKHYNSRNEKITWWGTENGKYRWWWPVN